MRALPRVTSKQREAEDRLVAARAAESKAQSDLHDAITAQQTAAGRLASLQGHQYDTALALVAAHQRLEHLAVASYLSGGTPVAELNAVLGSSGPAELGQRQVLVGAVAKTLHDAEVALRDAERRAAGQATPAANQVDQANLAVSAAQTREADAAARLRAAQSDYDAAAGLVQLTDLASPDPGSDIPRIVLEAYQHAAEVFATTDPACKISWQDLAALGRIESGNAQHGSTRLAADGETTPPILGPPLDGTAGNQALAKPAGLAYDDGSGPWERAVGPMQFLPTTWAVYGMVGIADHTVPDPNNAFDASMGAANVLCHDAWPQGMESLAGIKQAYFSYNHSASYVAEALANALDYGATITPLPSASDLLAP